MPRKNPPKKTQKKAAAKTGKRKAADHSSKKSFSQARKKLAEEMAKLSKGEKERIRALAQGLSEKEIKILWKYYMQVETRTRAGKVFQGIAKRYNATSGELELAVFLRTAGLVWQKK
jgi:hypothetical protein